MRRSLAVTAPAAALILTAAGCGGGALAASGGSGGSAQPVAAVSKAKHRTVVDSRQTSLGKVLTDSSGRTLYMFGADTRGHSNCHGACASEWPALLAHGRISAGAGVKHAKLGTIKRGHARQVTYAGHPLYRFAGDSAPGQTSGNGLNDFGGIWHAIGPSGSAASTSSGTTTSGGGSSTGTTSNPYGY